MLVQHFIDVTGVVALSLNIRALLGASDRAMLKTTGWASAIWAMNSLLIGAHTAAALSALSVGRQVGASMLLNHPTRTKTIAFAVLVAATLGIATLTWSGVRTLFPVAGSLIASYAMLYMRGAALRWAMVLVSAFWMVNAVAFDAWWQIVANGLAGTAAAVGALRARAPMPAQRDTHPCAPECDACACA
jgi:hypothetical protein